MPVGTRNMKIATALASGTIHRAGGMVSANAAPIAISAIQNKVVAGKPCAPGAPNITNGTTTPRPAPPRIHQTLRALASLPSANGNAARPTNAGASGLARPATSRPAAASGKRFRLKASIAASAIAAPTENATRPDNMLRTAAAVIAHISTVGWDPPLESGIDSDAMIAVAMHSRSNDPVRVDRAGTMSE